MANAKKLSEVIANAIAPFLAKYLPLTGGELSGKIFLKNETRKTELTYNKLRFHPGVVGTGAGLGLEFINSADDSVAGGIGAYVKMNNGEGSIGYYFFGKSTADTVIRITEDGKVGIGKNLNPTAPLHVDGDIKCSGTINGVSPASLVSVDDLKEVLSTDQISKLQSKMQQRIIKLQFADNQQINGGGTA